MGSLEQVIPDAFGWELILDLHNCNPAKIRSRDKITSFVIELCRLLDMRRHGEPWAERFGLNSPKTAGYSVVQLIETSSIVAHFSELTNSVYLDIFSCKPFDQDRIVGFCYYFFEAKTTKTRCLVRG